MDYSDKELTCKNCNNQFVLSAGEQEFYKSKGLENEPARCPSCRAERKRNSGHMRAPKKLFDVTCAQCGINTQVPFEPKTQKPVYCRPCFDKISSTVTVNA